MNAPTPSIRSLAHGERTTRWGCAQRLLADALGGIRADFHRYVAVLCGFAVTGAALAASLILLLDLSNKVDSAERLLGCDWFSLAPAGAEATGIDAAVWVNELAGVLSSNIQDATVSRAVSFRISEPGDCLIAVGCDPAYLAAAGVTRLAGRLLDEADASSGARNACISAAAAQRSGRTIGDSIPILGTPYRIVGRVQVFEPPAAADRNYLPRTVGGNCLFVPWQALDTLRSDSKGLDIAGYVTVRAKNISVDRAERLVRNLIAAPDMIERFGAPQWFSPGRALAGLRRMQDMVRVVTGAVGLLCLALSCAALATALLAVAAKRTGEIGLRLAMGAMPNDIAALFVAEAVVLALAAALPGCCVCIAVLALCGYGGTVLDAGPLPFLLMLGVLGAISALVATVPARVAARLSPSAALRND